MSDTRAELISLARSELAMLQTLRAARAANVDERASRFEELEALWKESDGKARAKACRKTFRERHGSMTPR